MARRTLSEPADDLDRATPGAATEEYAPDLGGAGEPNESGVSLEPDVLRRRVADEEARREILASFIARNLKPGTDFGTINQNGKESKPSLFKPGAEKICLLFQLRPRFIADRATLAMAGNPPGLFAYMCRLIDRQGRIVGEGRGAADVGERAGWTVNNAIKICEKRAQVDAVLRVAGLSEIFTQDLEDMEQRQALEHEQASRRPPRPAGPLVAEAASGYPAPAPAAPPPALAPAAPVPTVAPTAGDELCSEQQQRAIRALLPRAGLTEDEMVSKLGVATLADLPRGKAARVIDRLTVNARERARPSG